MSSIVTGYLFSTFMEHKTSQNHAGVLGSGFLKGAKSLLIFITKHMSKAERWVYGTLVVAFFNMSGILILR